MTDAHTRSARHHARTRRSPILWSELLRVVRRPSGRALVKAAGALVATVGVATAATASPVGATVFSLTNAPAAETGTVVSAPEAAFVARPSYGVIGFKATARKRATAAGTTGTGETEQVSRGIRRSGLRNELGLSQHGLVVLNAVRDNFPQIHSYGGFRAGDMDHGTGNAVDIMVSSRSQGDSVASYVMAHASELNVKYVIWYQRIWYPSSGTWKPMADRGGTTANHMDHVHVSVN